MTTPGAMSGALIDWYQATARALPWRAPNTSPWAILVSEFMLQQTQVDRVIPKWEAWLHRWPSPTALAADAPGEAVRLWDRLGYPRRALWLHQAAVAIAARPHQDVPRDLDELLALPGVGPYTARAVAVFAFGDRHPVVDTNTRRVLARALHGQAQAGMPSVRDLDDMETILPAQKEASALVNAAAMELGAVVCTARAPRCDACPLARWCEWRGAGYPDNAPAKRPRQAAFAGSDRQIRGRIMARVRSASAAVSREEALAAAADGGVTEASQPERALESLLADGLLVAAPEGFQLP